jgi:hypothetical protein
MPVAEPDLLILGDSHSVALKAGCDALGLRAEMLSFSGNIWHQGLVSLHRNRGIFVRNRAFQQRVAELAGRLGRGNVLSAEVPVLASFGFHLGRIVPPFGYNGHRTDAEGFLADETSQFASRALAEAYVRHFRRGHVRMLRRLSDMVPTIAVAPPDIFGAANYPLFVTIVKEMIREAGVALFDPCAELFPGQAGLPERFLTEDGVHGNAAYGQRVIGLLLDRGLIARRVA